MKNSALRKWDIQQCDTTQTTNKIQIVYTTGIFTFLQGLVYITLNHRLFASFSPA